MGNAGYKSNRSSSSNTTSSSPTHPRSSPSPSQADLHSRSTTSSPPSSPPPTLSPPTTPEHLDLPSKSKRKNHRRGKKTKRKARKAKNAVDRDEKIIDVLRSEKDDGTGIEVVVDEVCFEEDVFCDLSFVLEAWVRQGIVPDIVRGTSTSATRAGIEYEGVCEENGEEDESTIEVLDVKDEVAVTMADNAIVDEGKCNDRPPTPPPTPPTSALETTFSPNGTGEGTSNSTKEAVPEESASVTEKDIICDTDTSINTYKNIFIPQEAEDMAVENGREGVSNVGGERDVAVLREVFRAEVVGDEIAAAAVVDTVPGAGSAEISRITPLMEEDGGAGDEARKKTTDMVSEPVQPAAELETLAIEMAITIETPTPNSSQDDAPSPPEQETTTPEAETRSPELPLPLPQTQPPKPSTNPPKPRRTLKKSYYKVAPTPTAGLGMYATREIPRGTRILSELPLLLISDSEMSFSAILPAYASLPTFQKTQLLSLSGTEDAVEREGLACFLAELDNQTPPSKRIALSSEEQAAVQMIFRTNSFSVGAGRSAMFVEASRMNHSCVPNVYHTWNENLGRLTVHALRDIKAGEEILTTYISALLTREMRADEDHLGNYGFVCACPACDPKSKFFRESEVRRELAVRVEGMLAPYFAVGDLGATFKYGVGRLKGPEEGLRLAQLRVKVVMEEGVVNMDLVKCIHQAGQLALLCGDGEEAMNCANVALALTKTCCGDDSPHLEALRQQLRDVERFMRLR